MDLQLAKDRQWRRVRPDQAKMAMAKKGHRGGPSMMEADELDDPRRGIWGGRDWKIGFA